jgi:hypothetical protein
VYKQRLTTVVVRGIGSRRQVDKAESPSTTGINIIDGVAIPKVGWRGMYSQKVKTPSAQSGRPREPEVFERIKNLRVSKWLDAENVPKHYRQT